MMKLLSAKSWIILISCCIGTGIAFACADGWDQEYGVSNFTPELFVDSAYTPFFYATYQFYYGIGYDEQQHTRFNDSNTKEWAVFLNKQVSAAELEYLLQKASNKTIDSLASYMFGHSAAFPAGMQSFLLLKQKNDKNCNAFIAYLQLAKQCEAFSLNEVVVSWDVDAKPKKAKPFDASALNRNLQNGLAKAADPFIKERYWFQLVRSYFFNGNPQQAIDCFNNYEKGMAHNNTYYRVLAYTAGAFNKLKDFSKANYYYSKVYTASDELKTVAHYSFHPQEEKDWNATLALCTNTEEKITLWQMLGIFYADEQRSISEIYQLNPSSDKLDVLLARAVNKYEQVFNPRPAETKGSDTTISQALPVLVTKIAAANNTNKPWIWQLAAGYLQTLNEQYDVATGWFNKVGKSLPVTKVAQAQWRLLKMINVIAQAKKIDGKLELRVLEDIEWLRNIDPKEMPNLRYADAFEWLKQTMSNKYRQQNDWVKAECFFSRTSFYTDNKNIESMKAFLGKPVKTAFEKLCVDLSVKKADDLFEFQAIRLAYADSTDEALEKMQHAGKGAAAELAGNPFNGRILDCHDCDHEAVQKIKYTKLSFLQKLQELKKKIAAGEDVYTNALLLANAHYNITHFGNARFFYEGSILGESHSDPYLIAAEFRKMLTGTGMAKKYYSLAFQAAATDEQKAKCQYMLAKCERNQWYNDYVYNQKDGYTEQKMVDLKIMDGFKNLKQYSNTQYYKEVIKECGYFKTYTGK